MIAALPPTVPFVPPEALERCNGRPLAVRVGANESAFGISTCARAAMAEEVDRIGWYNDPEAYDLRQAIAAFHGVQPAEVSVGAGIDELLRALAELVLPTGRAVPERPAAELRACAMLAPEVA